MNFQKKIYQFHIYAGIFLALHLSVFALSGLVLLLRDEVANVGAGNSTEESSRVTGILNEREVAAGYASVLQAFHARFPEDRPLAFFPDENSPYLLQVRSGKAGSTQLRGARRTSAELRSGKLRDVPETAEADWLLALHRELLLGANGKLYVGFVGLIYVFTLLSGFFLYGKFMRRRALGALRKSPPLRRLDWHKFLGVITFGWSLAIAVTGVLLALNGVLIRIFQKVSLAHLADRYAGNGGISSASLAPLDRVITAALVAKPGSFVSYLAFPDTEYGIAGNFLVLMNGTVGIARRLSELLVIDAQTGKLNEVVSLPFYLRWVLMAEPLHFGDFGGLPLKIVWALFTVGSLAVVLLGVFAFFRKRGDRFKNNLGLQPLNDVATPSAPVPVPLTAPLQSSKRSPYLTPLFLAGCIFLGLGIGLLASNELYSPATAVLIGVLIFAISRWRKNAEN